MFFKISPFQKIQVGGYLNKLSTIILKIFKNWIFNRQAKPKFGTLPLKKKHFFSKNVFSSSIFIWGSNDLKRGRYWQSNILDLDQSFPHPTLYYERRKKVLRVNIQEYYANSSPEG